MSQQPLASTSDRLLKLPEVEALVGLKRASIYRFVQAKKFPAPVKLGERAVAWRLSAVDKWIEERTHQVPTQ